MLIKILDRVHRDDVCVEEVLARGVDSGRARASGKAQRLETARPTLLGLL